MELAAVGRDEFVQGFKLAGVRKTFSVARDQLEAQVAKVLEDANVGILILSADDMGALSHSLRHRLETTPRPVVIADVSCFFSSTNSVAVVACATR